MKLPQYAFYGLVAILGILIFVFIISPLRKGYRWGSQPFGFELFFVPSIGLILGVLILFILASILKMKDSAKLAKRLGIVTFIYAVFVLIGTPWYTNVPSLIAVLLVIFTLFVLTAILFAVNERIEKQTFEGTPGLLLCFVIGVCIPGLIVVWDIRQPYSTGYVPGAPEVCSMPAGMTCSKAYLSSETDTLNITLVNGLQKAIIITNMSCSKNYGHSEPVQEIEMATGQSDWFVMACSDENGKPMKFEQGDYYSGKINLEYYFFDEGPSAKRKIIGNLYTRAT